MSRSLGVSLGFVILEVSAARLSISSKVFEEFMAVRTIPISRYSEYKSVWESTTTLMYRPPEMCDPYKLFKVDEKVDIWMLGCVLFTMAFFKHPFQECMELAIINANFTFPSNSNYSKKLENLIRNLLTPNPDYRQNIFALLGQLENYHNLSSIELNVTYHYKKINIARGKRVIRRAN